MRAMVAVGVIFAGLADDADLELAGPHHADPAFGDLAVPAYQNIGHVAPDPFP